METARIAAPEVDRLVFSVTTHLEAEHGPELLERARANGLDSLELLPHLGAFLHRDRLELPIALTRMRYMPPEKVKGRLSEFERVGLVEREGDSFRATDPMRGLLDALFDAFADLAASRWSEHGDAVEIASSLARRLAERTSDEHEVAVAYARLTEPADPFFRLFERLTNLRYIRAHDHAVAWARAGLSTAGILAMTASWKGDGAEGSGLDELVAKGWAERHPVRLTPDGLTARESIEAETNRLNQETFNALDDHESSSFLTAITNLPGTAA